MPIVVTAIVPVGFARLHAAHKVRHVHPMRIVAAAIAWVGFARIRVACKVRRVRTIRIVAATYVSMRCVRLHVVFVVRRVRPILIVAPIYVVTAFVGNSVVLRRERRVCPTPIVVKIRVTRVGAFAEMSDVMPKIFLVHRTEIAAAGWSAIRWTNFAPLSRARKRTMPAVRMVNVAVFIAAELVNARQTA